MTQEASWLDVADAAKLCGVTTGTVYGWVNAGKVNAKTSYSFRKGRTLVEVGSLPKPKKPAR